MAIQKVQTNTGTSTLASTVVAFTNNVVLGNLIVVAVATNLSSDVSGITDTLGNSYVNALVGNGTGIEVELWYAKNILGGANTVTVAYTSGPTASVIIQEYSGIDTVTVLDQTKTGAGNSNSLDSGSTTRTNQTLDLLIGIGGAISATFTAGGSFVNLTQVANVTIDLAIEDLFVTSSGTYNATFGASGSIQWACGIAGFRAAPQGTTTSTSSTSASTFSTSSTSSSISSTSSSISSTSVSVSTSSTSLSTSSTSSSISSTSSSVSSTSQSSTSASTSISSTSSSISSTSFSSTSQSSTSASTSISSTSSSFSSTSSSVSSTSVSTSSTSFSSTSSSSSTSTTAIELKRNYRYEDDNILDTNNANIDNPFTSPQVAQVLGDDGDYFIEYGSEYMMRQYKYKHVNNTDGVRFTWKGRSTEDTQTSPILIQIYNQGTLASNTVDSYSESNQDSSSIHISGSASVEAGQSFTGSGSAVTSVKFYLEKQNAPTGSAFAKIYAHSGVFGTSSLPTGAALATSDAFDVTTLSTSAFTLVTITFSGANQITLTNGTKYVLGLNSLSIGGGSTDQVIIGQDASSPTHAGNAYHDTAADATVDTCFYVISQTGNAPAWETLARETRVPADTDFTATVTQSSNMSNYYDSSNIITFRSYQQVI